MRHFDRFWQKDLGLTNSSRNWLIPCPKGLKNWLLFLVRDSMPEQFNTKSVKYFKQNSEAVYGQDPQFILSQM